MQSSRRTTSLRISARSLSASLVAVAFAAGCSSDAPGDGGTGGTPSTGGTSATGGAASSGGQASSGGGLPTGGIPATGGSATGGSATGSGGASPTGGSPSDGGSAAGGAGGDSGGTTAGGAPSGGTSGSGGIGSAGGSGGVASNCSASLAAGETNRAVEIDGMQRTFILQVPQGYTGTDPVPLLLDWHPLGGTGSQQKGLSGMEALSEQEGFLILWPDGIDNAWNVGPCCTNSRDIDDVAFARAMVEDLKGIACVDPKRIYASGFSMGGGMSHYLACHAADIFAAVAPSAFDLLTENVEGCLPSRPVSVFAMRGTNDTVVPFNGGPGSSGKATFLGAQATLEKWAELNDCQGDPDVSGDTQMYTNCAGGVEVGLLTQQGGSHAPGPANVAWDFLSDKALP